MYISQELLKLFPLLETVGRPWCPGIVTSPRGIKLGYWMDMNLMSFLVSKKSPTGPTERTPKKPEYLVALATYLGVRW